MLLREENLRVKKSSDGKSCQIKRKICCVQLDVELGSLVGFDTVAEWIGELTEDGGFVDVYACRRRESRLKINTNNIACCKSESRVDIIWLTNHMKYYNHLCFLKVINEK